MNRKINNTWHEPVLHWVERRAQYLGMPGSLDWVVRDPVVGCLAPILFIMHREQRVTLSESARELTAQLYYRNKARWIQRGHRLVKYIRTLQQAGIQVIPLKGAILADQLYHDSGLRTMCDIDILVRPGDFLPAARLLLQSGLRISPDDSFGDLTLLERLPVPYRPGEIGFSDGQGLLIELHQNLITYPWFLPAYPLDIAAVWGRSLEKTDKGQAYHTPDESIWQRFLSPYDTLVHLCLHLTLHGLQAMQTYLDVDLWIRNLPASWDWAEFIKLINKWQIRSATYHVLSFCREFMLTPLPENLLQQLDPGRLARWRVSLLISSEVLLANQSSPGKRYPTLVKLALIDRLPRLFWTLLKLAFPSQAWFNSNPQKRNRITHWLHVWQVLKRGD